MLAIFYRFVNINYKLHFFFSIIIRLLLIVYGIYHDQVSKVKYTDVDYKVFTDAAQHILNGNSPYDRHTYRYSPLIAICLIPNLTLHHSFGKILFSLVDILVAILIRLIVQNTIREYQHYINRHNKVIKHKPPEPKHTRSFKNRKKSHQSNKRVIPLSEKVAEVASTLDIEQSINISMLMWLYNPLTIAIGTRGNCDSLSSFFVLLTLYVIQFKRRYFAAGVIHGISIHFRLYPIIYSLTLFMFLSNFAFYGVEDQKRRFRDPKTTKKKSDTITHYITKFTSITLQSSSLDGQIIEQIGDKRTIFKKEYLLFLVPNLNQLRLISGCLLSLSCLTCIFYKLYGYQFLYETYIYHFIRKDTRHNFSMYFYLLYLSASVENVGIWQRVLIVLPQLVLLLVFSVHYGLNKFSLNFAILTQTIVMVIYNTVITSQYFVWIMGILPICMWQIKMTGRMAIFWLILWFVAQGAWLLPAYLLEYRGYNTFFFIWIQSVCFFCVNIAILGRLITNFMPIKEKSV